ncbi:unnamed protein product [Musa acuminata subsp. burmannicoides]
MIDVHIRKQGGRNIRDRLKSTDWGSEPGGGGSAREVGGEAGGDGGVVHDVVERLRLHGPHPQLPRLLLRERHEPPPRRPPALPLRLRRGPFPGSLQRRGAVDVVGLRRPPEQRDPPAVAASAGGLRGGQPPPAAVARARPDHCRPDRGEDQTRSHFSLSHDPAFLLC